MPSPISPSQTDANSPVDDNLMDSIRLDLNYFDAILAEGNGIFSFNANGPLRRLTPYKKAVDTVALYKQFTPTTARAVLKKSGISGTLTMDIRKMTSPRSAIISISHLFEGATQSITNINPAIATQSIARSTPQVATQSISFAKSSVNVLSIINVGTNLWRYNLSAAPDADWVGASVTFASCTSSGNNGTFTPVELNQSGYPSLVVSNASGVAQTGAVGTGQVNIMSYNLLNPASSQFVAGDTAVFASHTTSSNNGNLVIWKINQGGNNIWVQNAGATQAGVVGNINNFIWVFTFLSSVGADFAVGESAVTTSHTTSGNNGSLPIRAINSSGNNLYLYNVSGAAQAGVAGVVGTNRWSYNLLSAATNISVGDSLQLDSHTNALNNGIFTAKQVNRSAANNVIVYNTAGVAQGGAVGFTRTSKKIVAFATDQSSHYTANVSLVDIVGAFDPLYNYANSMDAFLVTAVNQGGGSNFNIVISVPSAASQTNPSGYIIQEYQSLLSAPFLMVADPTANHENRFTQVVTTSFLGTIIPDNVPVGLFVTSMQDGDPQDLTVVMH